MRAAPMTTLARRYHLLDVLGRGAYGEVREARDGITGERVAVKLLRGIDADDTARVRREIATLRRLRIPGVVRLLDEGADGDTTFLVMERVDGAAFPGRRGPVAWSELARPALSLAETLARIHEAGVVHRDLKPGNVLVGPDGRTTVLDFGIARGLVERRQAAALEGTPAYLSPEQVMGDPVTPRADLFSLGVMLYEALTGALPFIGANAHGVMLARLTEVPSTLGALGVAAPERVSVLVARMLARRPEDRPRSAWEVAALLRGDAAITARSDAHPWFGGRGLVEALNPNTMQWGPVCDDTFVDSNNGKGPAVLCRELGFSGVTSWMSTTGATNFVLDNVDCAGSEGSIFDCPHGAFGVHNCSAGENSFVTCTE